MCATVVLMTEAKKTLDATDPAITEEWHPSRNGLLNPDQVTRNSNKKVWWLATCGHEWDSKVYSRVAHPKCPICMNKRVQQGVNDLATTHPELYSEWSRENEKEATQVSARSKFKASWEGSCGHTWIASVFRRSEGAGCPFCVSHGARALPGFNDLATANPTLAKQWGACNLKAPNEVTTQSSYVADWVCPDGHTWAAAVYSRARGQGCPNCSGRAVTLGVNDLITVATDVAAEWSGRNTLRASQVHSGSKSTAWWVCRNHHEWEAPIYARVRGTNCPKCSNRGTSRVEQEVTEFVSGLVTVKERDRKTLGGRELDILCPDQKVAIEFNGLYWHSEAQVHKMLHSEKSLIAAQAGYQLIHVWEDDWATKRPIVERMITRKLGKSNEPRFNARSLVKVAITAREARVFLDANHIQGFTSGSWYGSLQDSEGSIKAILVFRKTPNPGEFYLDRFATDGIVRGGFSRLFKWALTETGATKVTTFADRGVSDGGLYDNHGFVVDKELEPDYMYVVGSKRQHKFAYRKARFEKDPNLKFEGGLTERQLANLNGLLRIYDAGKTRWVWGL